MGNIGDNSVRGTGIKINLNMTPIDGFHLANIEWEAKVFTDTGFKTVVITKFESTRIDDDNYILPVDTGICGSGKYYVTLEAKIPDGGFPDGIRKEIRTAFTGITIDAR